MYRINAEGDKDKSGTGCHEFTWSEVPWKWLAILKARKWIKEDPKIFHVYIENISSKYWNDRTSTGKTVWEWNVGSPLSKPMNKQLLYIFTIIANMLAASVMTWFACYNYDCGNIGWMIFDIIIVMMNLYNIFTLSRNLSKIKNDTK